MVVQQVALPPYRSGVTGSTLCLHCCLCEVLHILRVCMGFLQVHLFPGTMLFGALVPLGVNECMNVCAHGALSHAQCSRDRFLG